MNFLAHLYLSGESTDLIIGNFIGDAVKGRDLSRFREGIVKGIRMHRAIDFYTDNHPVTERSRLRLRPQYHKYAGVIADVYYDHYLARRWPNYSSETLSAYADRMYRLIESNAEVLPEKSAFMLPYMKKHDWLSSYASIEGVRRALTGMSRRTSFVSNMEFAADTLEEHYESFAQDFEDYFPDLIRFTETFR